ncbi:MAG: PilZ domain-containing protein [Bdellovibrio sp.]|nr:MAG: PilZ domain-containing protein [Bdellovibrio sp.]
MASALKKFVPRAPRYVFLSNEEEFIRFAPKDDKDHTFTTRLLDISMTGLAFVTSKDAAPKKGEIIKLELPLLNGKHIAWWGKVARKEEYTPKNEWLHRSDFHGENRVLIGVQFLDLPAEFRKEIEELVRTKFQELRKRNQQERQRAIMLYILENFWRLVTYIIVTTAAVSILYWLAKPSENYDPKRGTFWGKRFEIFHFDESSE